MTTLRRNSLSLCALAAVVLLAVPFLGAETVTMAELWDKSSVGHRIFVELRLPRLLLTILVGGALAILGGTYQILFRNPLAEPYVLGISSAVTLGIAIAEIGFAFPQGSVTATLFGCIAALMVTFLLSRMAASRLGSSLDRTILFGLGVNFVLSSILFLLLSYHYQHVGGGSLRWLFGQIPWLNWREALGLAAAAPFFLLPLFLLSRHLDALQLGDSVARTLGFSPERSRVLFISVTSVYLAMMVAMTGSIGFVGLVVPHMVRLAVRPTSARQLLAISFVLGAVFLSVSDVISRILLPPFEFPIGVMTTVVGGPLFLWLLWKR